MSTSPKPLTKSINNTKMTPPSTTHSNSTSSSTSHQKGRIDNRNVQTESSSKTLLSDLSNLSLHFSTGSNGSSNSSSNFSSSASASLSRSSSVDVFDEDFIAGTSHSFISPQILQHSSPQHQSPYYHNESTQQHQRSKTKSAANSSYFTTRRPSSSKITTLKERYVFSNFRFLVKDSFCIPDVDEALDWLDIEMVLVPEIEHHHVCSICLDLLICPQFTRCGHIYCLPCLLQYFQSSDPVPGTGARWRSCPVCAELVHLKQLRPIHFCPTTEPREGDIFHSILLLKPVKSQFPIPSHSHSHQYTNLSISDLSPFQRLIPINTAFVLNEIILPEILSIKEEIKGRRGRGEESLEISYLEAALKFTEEKRWTINNSASNTVIGSIGSNSDLVLNSHNDNKKQSYDYNSSPNTRTKCTASITLNTKNNNYNNNHSNPKIIGTEAKFYFHQSRDGLNVFLHPFCMKLLLSEYLEYSKIPAELSLPILQCDRLIVNEGNRKRFKYLDHLPLGAQIILAEVDLEGVVSSQVLLQHAKEVKARDSARRLKKQHETVRKSTLSTSILDEWKRMEDDFYDSISMCSAAIPIQAPEPVNLNNLYDEASFPLPSSSWTSPPPPSLPMATRRNSVTVTSSSSSFADIASSPPSFSDLATSLNSPYFFTTNHTQTQTHTQTRSSPISTSITSPISVVNSDSNFVSEPVSESSQPQPQPRSFDSFPNTPPQNTTLSGTATGTGAKKKFVLFTNDMMNRRR